MLQLENTKFCWAWDRVYVKANGRIPCWCDYGEKHTVLHKPIDGNDFIRDIVNSEEMRKMRTSILRKNKYYIKECKNCCCMYDINRGKHSRFDDHEEVDIQEKVDKAKKFLDHYSNAIRPDGWINHISEIQIEPSFPCNLKCPGCLQGRHANPLSTEPKPHILPLEWFKRIIDSIIYNETKLQRIAFVGRGEPTLHKNLGAMILYARKAMPNLVMSMDTNSNQQFLDEYSELTWINCSIDGSNQDSYAKYRRGGNFKKAMQFLKDSSIKKGKCQIKWKYILFDTNDDVESMNVAQKISKDIGIDELLFVLTHAGGGDVNPSKKFTKLKDVEEYIKDNKIFNNTHVLHAT